MGISTHTNLHGFCLKKNSYLAQVGRRYNSQYNSNYFGFSYVAKFCPIPPTANFWTVKSYIHLPGSKHHWPKWNLLLSKPAHDCTVIVFLFNFFDLCTFFYLLISRPKFRSNATGHIVLYLQLVLLFYEMLQIMVEESVSKWNILSRCFHTTNIFLWPYHTQLWFLPTQYLVIYGSPQIIHLSCPLGYFFVYMHKSPCCTKAESESGFHIF